jgi:hypothetical protein
VRHVMSACLNGRKRVQVGFPALATRIQPSPCKPDESERRCRFSQKEQSMRKKNQTMRTKEQKLTCPVCHKPIKANTNLSMIDPEKREIFRSRPGDLTECPHCLVILELQGDPLSLRRPSKDRVQRFNELTRESKERSLAGLLEYVRRYRQMPRSV